MSLRSRLSRMMPGPAEHPRPRPPPGALNLVMVVLDSCRFDSFVTAKPTMMPRLGELERRFSYASWTSPAHFNLLMGLLPHPSPRNVFASDHYRKDFARYRERLGMDDVSFLNMLPRLWLPHFLRHAGYYTRAMTSLPVLNPDTPLNQDFDSFELMPRHNDLDAMVRRMRFSEEHPTFYLLNAGETHYPYATPDEPESSWPRISGVGGVWRDVDASLRAGQGISAEDAPSLFDDARLKILHDRQTNAVRHIDRVMERLFDTVPKRTWIIITADHGELFGEGGYFGHGPINHELVLTVPFIEGRLR